MAAAYSKSNAPRAPQGSDRGEWQALRGELVALLDQVEDMAGGRPGTSQYAGLARRLRDLRQNVDQAGGGEARHSEALRSVKRAVDRFSERDELAEMSATSSEALRLAISEIRGTDPAPARQQQRQAPQFDELARLVGALTGRLERLEGELHTQRASQGSVKEVADQVAQLTHVVELLAGAVGETGQVKRLEAQIAAIADMIGDGPRLDVSSLNTRLDDLSQTVERLAEMQTRQIAEDGQSADQAGATLKSGMDAIEQSVRTVYDRIDAIERKVAIAPAEFEKLTAEMASFTKAMKTREAKPDVLLGRLDALNARIERIEGADSDIAGLKADIAALRGVVAEAIEPRFAAIHAQIEALSDRVSGERAPDPGIGQLESQIRQLVLRMDETGEQLDGLAKLYNTIETGPAMPDIEALATLVALKASEAFARAEPTTNGLSDDGLAALETRLSRLFADAGKDGQPEELSHVQDGIKRVDERLARLEDALTRGERPAAPVMNVSPVREAMTPRRAEPAVTARDAMPKDPAGTDPVGLGLPAPSSAATAGGLQGSPKARHPGIDDAAMRPFDPAAIERPARPRSALDVETPKPQSEPVEAPQSAPEGMSSRNTFIEAARRAAQRQNAAPADANTNSLIGKALARFQANAAKAETKADPEPTPAPVRAEPKAEPAAARPPAPHSALSEAEEVIVSLEARDEDGAVRQPSFLVRHRQPILLAATVVAVCFLTLNLIGQRMGEEAIEARLLENQAADAAMIENLPELTAADAPTPVATEAAPALDADPRVIELSQGPLIGTPVDTLTTAAIDATTPAPAAAPQDTPMPAALSTASINGAPARLTPLELEAEQPVVEEADALGAPGPVQYELPAEGIGPLALREAAANGDPRAQFEVAAILTEGQLVGQDLAEAAKWYERSAAQGFAPAQYRLGTLYEGGEGVEQDFEQAQLWYLRAAEAGNRMSMHNLAALSAGGQLGRQQFEDAARWFEEAANRGMTDSQFNLGMLYARGLGVAQDLEASYKWFSLAADSGDADAAKARDDVARSLTADAVGRIGAELEIWQAASIDLAANFAPIGTWDAAFDPGEAIATPEVIVRVQAALGRLGYDVGTPDGVAGPKTAEAIMAFETATGMTAMGEINPRLLAVLGSQPV